MRSRDRSKKLLYHLTSTYVSLNPGPPLPGRPNVLPLPDRRGHGERTDLKLSWLKTTVLYFSPRIMPLVEWLGAWLCTSFGKPGPRCMEQPLSGMLLVWRKNETSGAHTSSSSSPHERYPLLLPMFHWPRPSHVVTPNVKWVRKSPHVTQRRTKTFVNSPNDYHKHLTSLSLSVFICNKGSVRLIS